MKSNTEVAVTRIERRRIFPRRLPRTMVAGGCLITLWVLITIFGPLIFSDDPTALHFELALLPPSFEHLFGTDNFGRDVLTRVVDGTAIDLQIGMFTVLPALTIGSIMGALAGYYGSLVDTLVMRLVDIVVAFPFFVLVIAIVAVLGPGLINMYIAVALVGWVSYARIVRSEMMVAKQLDYTLAAQVLGFSDLRILLRHLFPNVIIQALIYATSDFILGILLGSSLGFLGLGAQPPAPEWGVMIADGYSFLSLAPWISMFPGFVIVALAASFSLFGDGLADYLRPEIEK
jgi:peptide/nickel transport system permease protein